MSNILLWNDDCDTLAAGVVPPNVVLTKAGTFTTAATTQAGLSAPTALFYQGDAVVQAATYNAKDGANGDGVFSVRCAFLNISGVIGIYSRCTALPGAGFTGITSYALQVQPGTGASLTRFNAGTGTTIGAAIGAGAFGTVPLAYRMTLATAGANVTAFIQRMSDGQWLSAAGAWQAASTACFALVDTAPIDGTGGGYSGVYAYSTSANYVAFDNFLATYAAPTTLAGSDIQAACVSALSAQGYTTTRAAKLDNADAPTSGVPTAVTGATIDGAITLKNALELLVSIAGWNRTDGALNTTAHTQTVTYKNQAGTTVAVATVTYAADNKTTTGRTVVLTP